MELERNRRDKSLKANVKREKHSVFSTDAMVNHSPTEFRLTFFDTWMTRPADGGAIAQNKDVVSEVVLTPTHFKALCSAMQDNLKKYEGRFGEISMPGPRPGQSEEKDKDQTESYAYR
jgi:hypothetical protein